MVLYYLPEENMETILDTKSLKIYSEIIDIDYSCTYFIPFNKQNHMFRQLDI